MLNELEQKIRKAIPELYIALGYGKPIQLNHVLEYLVSLNQSQTYFILLIKRWSLKSNLLSDQPSELITFLNEL